MEKKIKFFLRGCKNLWRYKSIVWKDRDWDYYFTLLFLKTKLEYQLDDLEKYHNGNYAWIQKLRLVIRLLDRILSGDLTPEKEARMIKIAFQIMAKYLPYWWS